MKRRVRNLVWLVAVACAGCGETGTGIAVSGTVTRAGLPVKSGVILFRPVDGTRGAMIQGSIQDGRYRISPKQGLQAGRYTVELPAPPPDRGPDFRPTPPPKAPTMERDISGDDDQLNFDL